ncbi:MAG: PadR family transcriptional regulator [Candidatus Aminicenantes bacterium]|nr:PadR family transcriptional regulator [Candidatus Aminicenantes bacterium]
MENKITQLRKGILELAILGALSGGRHYGYSLVRTISGTGAIDLTEGTIYPILGRLAKEGLVRSEWVESSQGPPRKYYILTSKGEEVFGALDEEFRKLAAIVSNARDAAPPGDNGEDRAVLEVAKESNNG